MRMSWYSILRCTTNADTPLRREGIWVAPSKGLRPPMAGWSRVPDNESIAGALASNCPLPRSNVASSPSMSTPCTRMVDSNETWTSAIANTLDPSAKRMWRAKYSTCSELLKFTRGALMARPETGWSNACATKPSGAANTSSEPRGSEDASICPWSSSSATWRTSRFCRSAPCIKRLASGPSIQSRCRSARPSRLSKLASNTSTPSRVRFTAASAPATKRKACPSLLAIAVRYPSRTIKAATTITAATKNITEPMTARVAREEISRVTWAVGPRCR